MTVTTMRFPKKLIDILDRVARREGLNRSELVRAILWEWLERHGEVEG